MASMAYAFCADHPSSYDLPDYVFEEGQERPQKKKSKKRRDRESSGVAADDDDDHLKKARTSQEVSA